MTHRPWVQPRVPTGPIVIPATSSIGAQYAGVLLPQPILPFAANYVSLPLRDGRGGNPSGFADYTNHLTPPIFMEMGVKILLPVAATAAADAPAVAAVAPAADAVEPVVPPTF